MNKDSINLEQITYAKTVYGQEEIDAVVKCLGESTQMGKYSRNLEKNIAELFDKKHCLYVNSGSSALYIGMEAFNFEKGSEIITPALDELSEQDILVDGPFAADGYFGSQLYKIYDATLAMYHDQGLIPFKALSFGKGVNFTAGLPIIRTSPDHGTGFDIAGKGIARATSMFSALQTAWELSKNNCTN